MSNFKFPVKPTYVKLNEYLAKKDFRPFGYATTVVKMENLNHEIVFMIRQHGNLIAEIGPDYVWVCNQYYGTPTTRNRINKVLHANGVNAYVYQYKFVQYINVAGEEYQNFVSAVFTRDENSVYKYV